MVVNGALSSNVWHVWNAVQIQYMESLCIRKHVYTAKCCNRL